MASLPLAFCGLLAALSQGALGVVNFRGGGNVRKSKGCKERLDPFDCYKDKGEDYNGLQDMGSSGRKCANWIDQGEYKPPTKHIGNHNYCRNPDGKRERPWCFTIDPAKEWEYCQVAECVDNYTKLEPWESPEGAKSEEAEAEGPCEYEPPKRKPFKEAYESQACMDNRGKTWWLIGMKKIDVADEEGCFEHCQTKPGLEFFTFFKTKDDDGNNCGCYRECIPVPKDLTVHDPTSYEVE